MKKHLIALAVAAVVAAPAAMADTTLYGKVHMSIDSIDNGDTSDVNIASNSSRLGVKGSEKLSGGLSAIYQYEVEVNPADGSNLFGSTRNSFVGLTGGFGTFVAGTHDTPMKEVGRKYDLFGDQIGDSRNVIRGKVSGEDWDLRTPNTVAYVTPNMGGFGATLAYVTDYSAKDAAVENNDKSAYSLSAGYTAKMFDVAAAYEKHNTVSGNEPSAFRVGAGVNFGGLRVNALYQAASDTALEQKVWGLGAGYTFGKNEVKAQYFTETEDNTVSGDKGNMWAVGYDYKLSKQTTAYAAYAQGENGVTPWTQGHGVSVADTHTGETNKAFSVGMVHKF